MILHKPIVLAALLAFLAGPAICQLTLLSGPEKGSYNRFASDIVKVLNTKNNLKLANKTTTGSAYNFNSITNPESSFKITLIQSDYLYLMLAEDKLNNTNKAERLTVLMELAPEEIHLIVKQGSGIKTLQDLNQKKVGIGNQDQGSNATAKAIKERSKVNWFPYELDFTEMLKELSAGNVDAALMVGSAPLNMLDINPQAMPQPLDMIELTDFNGWARYYEHDTIYRQDYKWLDKDVPTFAVRTLLVVNESKLTNAEKETVAAIKSGIVENLAELRATGHPQWKSVLVPDASTTEAKPLLESSKAPEPITPDQTKTVVFKVQIYSRNYEINEAPIELNGNSYTPEVYSYMGAFRYTVGEFINLADAVALQKSCREAGYNQAFVAAFKNNERCTDPEVFK